jgi:hypothetical protein
VGDVRGLGVWTGGLVGWWALDATELIIALRSRH